MDEPLTLRPAGPDDRPFLFQVYAGARQQELERVDWSAAQKEAFLRQQFDAQDAFYRQNYPGADFQVILQAGQPAGRLYVHRRADEIRVMDIALLPGRRSRGLGARLLNAILDEGRRDGLPVTIHVERFNPALRLYERLGFRPVAGNDVYLLMEWSPS
jgi:GNAT superfamily N-acetyltransferase